MTYLHPQIHSIFLLQKVIHMFIGTFAFVYSYKYDSIVFVSEDMYIAWVLNIKLAHTPV
jgi:hypothetical protein